MNWLPAVAVHVITSSHPFDENLDGPEYEGRVLCIEWLGLMIEIALTRRVPEPPAAGRNW
jgi:hypothetical protein